MYIIIIKQVRTKPSWHYQVPLLCFRLNWYRYRCLLHLQAYCALLVKKKKYKCNWFYLTDLTDNLETIHVQVWESFIVESVSSHICCSYKIFLSQVIFIFPLFQLHYTIPKNKRKTEITWDKKLTTTYKSNSKREFLPHDFLSKRTVLSCFYLLIFYLEKFSTWVWCLPIMLQVKLISG